MLFEGRLRLKFLCALCALCVKKGSWSADVGVITSAYRSCAVLPAMSNDPRVLRSRSWVGLALRDVQFWIRATHASQA